MAGLVLAAGSGRRFGRPKGLVRGSDGEPWVAARARALREGGCAKVFVVLGAAAEEVALLVPEEAFLVHTPLWPSGLSASLAAGLRAVAADDEDWAAVLVVPVDVPDLGAPEVARVLARWPGRGLARAVHGGRPGHPVVLDRASWPSALTAAGDEGARGLLRGADVLLVECGDLGSGEDVDHAG